MKIIPRFPKGLTARSAVSAPCNPLPLERPPMGAESTGAESKTEELPGLVPGLHTHVNTWFVPQKEENMSD